MSLRHKEDSISLIRDKESINSKDRVKIIPYGEEPPLGETDVNRPCLFMCIKEVDAEGQPTAIEFRDCHGHVYPASSPELLKYLSGAPLNYSGTPVSIAYAGTNRIASITAYGENAQGGTTEAPVALTGVDSVHVCGRNLLPLPYSQVSETKNGLNIAVNADGTITVSGTATAETYLNLKPIPASLYRLMGVTGITPAYDYPVTKNGFTFFDLTIQPHVEFALVYIVITKGSVVNRTYRPYIIKSAEPLPYETYQGSVTPLPIPRALHEVGDVRDVCRTRVKSVWDKSVQVDITQLKKNSASPYQYYINVESNSVNIAVKPAASTLSYNLTTGIQPFKSGINFWMNGLLEVDDLEHAKAWFTEHPTKVFYQSTAYNGTNGLDVCLTEYQTGFVELDGTEGIEYQSAYNRFAYTLPSTAVDAFGGTERGYGRVMLGGFSTIGYSKLFFANLRAYITNSFSHIKVALGDINGNVVQQLIYSEANGFDATYTAANVFNINSANGNYYLILEVESGATHLGKNAIIEMNGCYLI